MKTTENIRRHIGETVTIKWGTSRGRDSYGYTTCSLRNQRGQRVAYCNGGGYDMRGTVLGNWLAATFPNELRALREQDMPENSHWDHQRKETVQDGRGFYGLTFHDPNYDPGNAIVGRDCSDRTLTAGDVGSAGKTVAEAEAAGASFGLERLQAAYKASSKFATERHTVPSIDGACGVESVNRIMAAIGITLRKVHDSSKMDVYVIEGVQP